MKAKLSVSVLFLLLAFAGQAQPTGNPVVQTILSGYSAKNFTSEPVSEHDINMVLECGIKAPSARNSQLWKFTVIKDESLISPVARFAKPGNVIIIVSGAETAPEGMNVDFDCALATENMYLAAQGLGLGAHIYTGPVRSINEKKQEYQIPEGYRAVSVLQIGHIDTGVDAISAASARKTKDELVNYGK
jgi:nitroreductase